MEQLVEDLTNGIVTAKIGPATAPRTTTAARAGRSRPTAPGAAPARADAQQSEPAYSNQSKATVPSAAYRPMTRPVNPPATSVDR